MMRRALVTRPEEDAAPLVAALAERGIDVRLEPLLSIHPLDEAAVDLAGVQALLFTSANGVRAFAQLAEMRGLAGWRGIPVFTVGDASAAAARAAGFATVESASGDVEALARLVIERLDPAAGPLFHAAGSAIAGDLAGRLADAGFELRRTMLYEAKPAEQLSPSTVADLANGAFDIVLFFSPRTAATFGNLVRAEGEGVVTGCRQARALCLSPAVAAVARELPWREVTSAARPDLPSILTLVDSLRAAAHTGAPQTIDGRMSETSAGEHAEDVAMTDSIATGSSRSSASASRNRLFAAAAVAAIVAAVIALGAEALRAWRSPVGEPPPAVADATTGSRLDALDARVGTIESTIETTRTQLDKLATAATTVERDIADLQAAPVRPGATSADVADLADRLGALEQKLAALAARPRAEPTAVPADSAALERLTTENAALRDKVAALEAALKPLDGLARRVDALDRAQTAQRDAAGAAAVALATSQLGAALTAGQPFAAELAALEDLAAADAGLNVELAEITAPIAPLAEKGVPTRADLESRFPAVAREVADAGQQQALANAAGTPEAGSWLDRLFGRLSSIVSIRPIGDVPGDAPAARVARAEARLDAGDLAGAATELAGLAGKPADAAAEWLAGARARLAADRAVAALQAAATARLVRPTAAATSGG